MLDNNVGEDDIVFVAPNEEVLDIEFYDGFGSADGPRVTVWTADKVYFPVVYDGSEWLESVSRNPVSEPISHVGGQ